MKAKTSTRKSLRKAVRLYRRRKYTYVINLLEPQVFLFRDNWTYYYTLGMSCLYTGDFAGAYSYLRRAGDLDPERVETFLGIGVVLLRRRQIDVAIQNYLDLIDKDPQNRRAKRALHWIRTLERPDGVVDWFDDGSIDRILPPRGLFVPKAVSISLVIAFVIGSAVVFGPSVASFIATTLPQGEQREGSSVLAFTDETQRISEENGALFEFTEGEIDELLDDIMDAFNDGRDNYVRRELNRIALSNASPRIKEQTALLKEYLSPPDFVSMRDNFTYEDVASNPPLYDGVFVRWRGRIANLVIGDDEIAFDFLVGYDSGSVLEGIVPVTIPFAVLLDDGGSVELIGSVSRDSSDATLFSIVTSDIRRTRSSE